MLSPTRNLDTDERQEREKVSLTANRGTSQAVQNESRDARVLPIHDEARPLVLCNTRLLSTATPTRGG